MLTFSDFPTPEVMRDRDFELLEVDIVNINYGLTLADSESEVEFIGDLNRRKIEKFRWLAETGEPVPPLVVNNAGELEDGYHRITAFILEGYDEVTAWVEKKYAEILKAKDVEMVLLSDIYYHDPDNEFSGVERILEEKLDVLLDDPDFEFPPILLYEDGWTIEDGNHRYMAYRRAGRKYIPVIFI